MIAGDMEAKTNLSQIEKEKRKERNQKIWNLV